MILPKKKAFNAIHIYHIHVCCYIYILIYIINVVSLCVRFVFFEQSYSTKQKWAVKTFVHAIYLVIIYYFVVGNYYKYIYGKELY